MMNDNIEKYLTAIREIFPSDIESVTVHNNGDDFFVVEINRVWMFRFPRNDISRRALKVETKFLTRFKSISPLTVPDYQYQTPQLVGYPKIPGTALSWDLFQSLSDGSRDRIARQIGGFLSAVHTFPVGEATLMGMAEGWNHWFNEMLKNFRQMVAPRLSPVARRNALTCIDRLLAEPFDSKVIHGDFALEDHVFFDEQRQELSGVIDFADSTLNDPAHDLQNIVEYGGEDYFAEVMKHYRSPNDPALLKRTKLRIETRPLFEASYSLMFGFEERYKDRLNYIETKYGA